MATIHPRKATPSMSTYDARNLLVLEGLEAVRKRPGIYVGSTATRGLRHCLWEIIDNSADEELPGHGTHSRVAPNHDGPVEDQHDSQGVPPDIQKKTRL